jgi:ADP-ribose pyrophosphatase
MAKTRTATVAWEGKFVRVKKAGRWEYAERTNAAGGVVIVAITDAGSLLLIEQERLPVASRVIELPAGLAGDIRGKETEDLATAARRELIEETGYDARDFKYLTGGPPSAGLSSEIVTFFKAEEVHRVSAGGGAGNEKLVVHEIPVESCATWLREQQTKGILVDPKVYAGLFFAGARLNPPGG